jgi:hypothetical protein
VKPVSIDSLTTPPPSPPVEEAWVELLHAVKSIVHSVKLAATAILVRGAMELFSFCGGVDQGG